MSAPIRRKRRRDPEQEVRKVKKQRLHDVLRKEEHLNQIFEFVGFDDFENLSLTCKDWHNACETTNSFWEDLIIPSVYSTREAVVFASRYGKSSSHIYICDSINVNDASLCDIGTKVPSIEHVTISRCPQITENGLASFVKSVGQGLKSLELSFGEVLEPERDDYDWTGVEESDFEISKHDDDESDDDEESDNDDDEEDDKNEGIEESKIENEEENEEEINESVANTTISQSSNDDQIEEKDIETKDELNHQHNNDNNNDFSSTIQSHMDFSKMLEALVTSSPMLEVLSIVAPANIEDDDDDDNNNTDANSDGEEEEEKEGSHPSPYLMPLKSQFSYQISSSSLEQLASLPLLKSLELSGCEFDYNAFARTISKLDHLTSLVLLDCIDLSSECLDAISRISGLEKLCLGGAMNLIDEQIINLVNSAPKLVELDISECPQLTEVTVDVIAEHLKDIETLRLFGCPHIEPLSLQRLAKSCPKLKHVDVGLHDGLEFKPVGWFDTDSIRQGWIVQEALDEDDDESSDDNNDNDDDDDAIFVHDISDESVAEVLQQIREGLSAKA